MGIIKKQGIANSAITYIGIFIGFVNVIFLQPRFLSAQELGLTRILYTTAYLLSAFIPLGSINIITRFFPKFKNSSNGHHGFLGFICLFLLAGTVLVFSAMWILKPYFIAQYQKESLLFTEFFNWLFPFSFILSLITVLIFYCYSLYKTLFSSILNEIMVRIVSIILFGLYFLKLFSIKTLITLFVSIYGLQLLGLILFIIRENAFNFNIDWNFIKQNNPKEMIRFALVFALAPVASYGIKFVDGIIMGKYLNLAMVGVYSIAVFIPTFIEAPMTALEKIANPKIADALHRNDVENIKDIYYKSCRYMMGLGGFLVLMIFINTQYLFTFLPEIYSKGIYVIYIVSFSALMNLYTGTNNTLVFNSSNYIFGTMLLFTIMLCTIGLSIVLIPVWGLEGAAIANTSAGMIYNIAKFVFIKHKYKLQPYDLRNLKILIITGVCLSVVWFLPEWKNIYLSGLYKSTLLGSIYLGGIYISKSITIKEILKG